VTPSPPPRTARRARWGERAGERSYQAHPRLNRSYEKSPPSRQNSDGQTQIRTGDTTIFSGGATSPTRRADRSKRPAFAAHFVWSPARPTVALPAEIPADTRGCRGVWAYGRCSSAQTPTGLVERMARLGIEPRTPQFSMERRPALTARLSVAKNGRLQAVSGCVSGRRRPCDPPRYLRIRADSWGCAATRGSAAQTPGAGLRASARRSGSSAGHVPVWTMTSAMLGICRRSSSSSSLPSW
jgi:hypothetical protein